MRERMRRAARDRQAATDCGRSRHGHNECAARSGPQTLRDNEFSSENNVLLHAPAVADRKDTNRRSKQCEPNPSRSTSRSPAKPPRSRCSSSTPIRSRKPARWSRPRSRARPSLSAPSRATAQADHPRYQERPSGDGLRLSHAEGDQARLEARGDGIRVRAHAHVKTVSLDGCNRLEVICHEDLDTSAAPWLVPFVATLPPLEFRYTSFEPGKQP
jgi:hypothetical protein